jgi:hypothetical protein
VIDYLGLIVGRPQNLVDLYLHVGLERDKPIILKTYWSMPPKRNRSSETERPNSFDVLLDAVRHSEEFSLVMSQWLERQKDWRSARWRFFNSFSKQRHYDIDRLIASANMFDILPDSAVPVSIDLSEELKSAQLASRKLFRALSQSPERDSVLGALGRLGKSNLKHKVRHRVREIAESSHEWLPDLAMVTDEAVNCRNYYVHGTDRRFDYDQNFSAVIFFTDTLEFVFAASDLVEAGWDLRSWISRGTTASHPFSRYRVNYPLALKQLKALIREPIG